MTSARFPQIKETVSQLLFVVCNEDRKFACHWTFLCPCPFPYLCYFCTCVYGYGYICISRNCHISLIFVFFTCRDQKGGGGEGGEEGKDMRGGGEGMRR